jgi:GT2 family glycosyltransferase
VPIMTGKVGVVTVTYNSATVLEEFLDSLASQTHSSLVLYAVDNASIDATAAMLRQRSGIAIVVIPNEQNLGVAEANNQGIRAALKDDCEYVLLLNNDTVFPRDMIAELLSGLDNYHCDMTTARMYYHDHPDRIWCAGGRISPWRGYDVVHDGADQSDLGQFDTARAVNYTPTCCLMARRSVFEEVGLMDGRYFVYMDDVDFLYRCSKHGLSLWYIPGARLWHKVSSLTRGVSNFTLRYCTRNRAYFFRKHLPYPLALGLYLGIQLRSLLTLVLLRNSWAKFLVRFRAAREGWRLGNEVSPAAG